MRHCILLLGMLVLVGFNFQTHNLNSNQFGQEPKIEVYIPVNMPVQIRLERDLAREDGFKYFVRRVADSDVDIIKYSQLLISPEYPDEQNKAVTDGSYAEVSTSKEYDVGSVAWGSQRRVARLIVIVREVETKTGKWIIDGDEKEAIASIMELGALPRARFVPKE